MTVRFKVRKDLALCKTIEINGKAFVCVRAKQLSVIRIQVVDTADQRCSEIDKLGET